MARPSPAGRAATPSPVEEHATDFGDVMSTASSSEKSRKDSKSGPKASKALTTSAKRIQKELAEITLDPPPNCR